MQLNNWLQGHGGTHRLAWNNYIVCGPRHRPKWRSECSVDGTLFGWGHGPSKGDAQEVAARMTLETLLSSYEAANPC
ncbi:hypothetical protein BJ322DRAFT_670755 [Thelephora terrestris]|uniref:DRBM domain-containing protein n=1 Tax=Thelephora terrestris TaxID=56493 RepID=A0A9P6L837_9AGAM|nr:hypothetical protein BJ322DRAFT_670755 [Thelephora terrestris]